MMRTGPPVPPLIIIGNAMRVAHFGGSLSRLATFSTKSPTRLGLGSTYDP